MLTEGAGGLKQLEAEMFGERVEGGSIVKDHLGSTDVPSGVLVGVSLGNLRRRIQVKKSGAENIGLLHVLVVQVMTEYAQGLLPDRIRDRLCRRAWSGECDGGAGRFIISEVDVLLLG